jgi:hypothetical protein
LRRLRFEPIGLLPHERKYSPDFQAFRSPATFPPALQVTGTAWRITGPESGPSITRNAKE